MGNPGLQQTTGGHRYGIAPGGPTGSNIKADVGDRRSGARTNLRGSSCHGPLMIPMHSMMISTVSQRRGTSAFAAALIVLVEVIPC